jgi:hypothetical protein
MATVQAGAAMSIAQFVTMIAVALTIIIMTVALPGVAGF